MYKSLIIKKILSKNNNIKQIARRIWSKSTTIRTSIYLKKHKNNLSKLLNQFNKLNKSQCNSKL